MLGCLANKALVLLNEKVFIAEMLLLYVNLVNCILVILS